MYLFSKCPLFILSSALVVSVLLTYGSCRKRNLKGTQHPNLTTTVRQFYKRDWWLKRVPILHHLCYPFFRFKIYTNICYKRYEIYAKGPRNMTRSPYKILRFRFLTQTPCPFWRGRVRPRTTSIYEAEPVFEFHKVPNE